MRLIVEYHSKLPSSKLRVFEGLKPLLVSVQLTDKEELEEFYIHEIVRSEAVVILRPMSGGGDRVVKVNDIKKVVVH